MYMIKSLYLRAHSLRLGCLELKHRTEETTQQKGLPLRLYWSDAFFQLISTEQYHIHGTDGRKHYIG